MRKMPNWIKAQYHWIVAALVFLEMAIFGGLINSASVFIHPISQGLGVSTTAYSVAMTPYTIACSLGTCVSDVLFRRFGYKKCALVSLGLVALSLVVVACAGNLWMVCIGKTMFGMGYAACFTAGSVRIVKNWFRKHQGTVLGLVSMATGLGGSVMTLVLSGVISKHGWRAANWVACAIVVAIGLLYLLLKDRPEELGRRVYGWEEAQKLDTSRAHGDRWEGYPFREQLKRPAFYIMTLCVTVSCVCIYTSSSFVAPHYASLGFTAEQAAVYQSVSMLVLAGFKLVAGFLYDRFGAKPVTVLCMLCAIAGQGMQAAVTDPGWNYLAVSLVSIGLCMTSIMVPLITMDVFGRQGSMGVNGILMGLCSLASIFANPISSMSYDAYGLYTPVYRVTALVNVGVLALYLVLFALGKRDRRQLAPETAEDQTR